MLKIEINFISWKHLLTMKSSKYNPKTPYLVCQGICSSKKREMKWRDQRKRLWRQRENNHMCSNYLIWNLWRSWSLCAWKLSFILLNCIISWDTFGEVQGSPKEAYWSQRWKAERLRPWTIYSTSCIVEWAFDFLIALLFTLFEMNTREVDSWPIQVVVTF